MLYRALHRILCCARESSNGSLEVLRLHLSSAPVEDQVVHNLLARCILLDCFILSRAGDPTVHSMSAEFLLCKLTARVPDYANLREPEKYRTMTDGAIMDAFGMPECGRARRFRLRCSTR